MIDEATAELAENIALDVHCLMVDRVEDIAHVNGVEEACLLAAVMGYVGGLLSGIAESPTVPLASDLQQIYQMARAAALESTSLASEEIIAAEALQAASILIEGRGE